ncbi:inositol polyphosphate-4-phosphatase type I A isoform X2 [Bradysia coprophila]|uniref:inositol polyphosphate-4-phosphatase type I A isoform X2 n=1 Tax=Bradysia coprophila TaxID=38358 RepID=UPI00187DCC83|nr:inositol polyphosphate-4-phosphatase type I A isoform X2 [Bradysia coprophila]
MRFNKQELATLATQPSNKFDKEGVLFVTEKQEGFFRRSEVSLERWCRLRGNLLFYFKTSDQFSEPQGVIVLEKCEANIRNNSREHDGFVFFIEFQDGLRQRLAAYTETERLDWIKSIQSASYGQLRKQLQMLREKIEKCKDTTHDVDVEMVRLQVGKEIDIGEIPICESAISCDNLLCDGHGRAPNPIVVIQVVAQNRNGWIKYSRTEVIERSSNPQFLCTIPFRSCDGLHSKSMIRFSVYDVREKVSQTAVPIGSAEIELGVIQDTTRLRIPLRSAAGTNAGFITIASWAPEQDRKTPRSPAKIVEQQHLGHRRSQSLPPKLGVKLFFPPQEKLALVFANPNIHTYRLHSGLGGDISVHEIMMECQLCFIIPQQLLSIWILREKELLQEISGIGELGGEWRNKQMDLLDKHLKLLKDYSQAKQNLQQYNSQKFFKSSASKTDEAFEFAPVNLHLQRMWAHNDTLKRSGVLDVITVGAFTKHAGKSKTGGLIKLLQQMKDSPSKMDQNGVKVQAANDAVQAIKQLRKEIVAIMSQLLCLAKSKNSKGMLPLCNEMVTKTRVLLNIWEPSLVEEAFEFIEKHRTVEEPDNFTMPMSPFKKITQQLGALDLKSPDLEDFATPMGSAPPDLWPSINANKSRSHNFKTKSPSSTDINAIATIQNTVKTYQSQTSHRRMSEMASSPSERMSYSLPVETVSSGESGGIKFNETHFDVNGDIVPGDEIQPTKPTTICDRMDHESVENSFAQQFAESRNEILHNSTEFDDNGLTQNCSIVLGHNGAFLDAKVMSSSPSANFYRPTEEPEPLDLTQLNIEASVMCLVSKVKFLCGRCGSPAVRLRQPKQSIKRGFSSLPPDVVTSQPIANSICTSDAEHSHISTTTETSSEIPLTKTGNLSSKDLNLALTQAVGEVTRKVKKGNKFTDGLDLSLTTDWASELRPSMRKLRQAMDGLLKTARLMHSVQRVQQDMKKTSVTLTTMYRRDVCFSQALTSLVAVLMAKLWGNQITENYVHILGNLGPLVYFEGLLSLYGLETDMWGDMCVAIEDLSSVQFTLVRSNIQRDTKALPVPRIIGSRQSIKVLLPVPESVHSILPTKETTSFKVTPVFFNIGINEKATLSETLGYTREQHRSNWDNFDRIKQYHIRYKKLNLSVPDTPSKTEITVQVQTVTDLLFEMEESLRSNASKNIKILHLAEDICRAVQGLRLTSCKSAKDRTGMAVTLEQCRILQKEFHLPASNLQNVMDTMRSKGTRCDNTVKNIGIRKYAFNLPQVLALPQLYRPPTGSYGKAQS